MKTTKSLFITIVFCIFLINAIKVDAQWTAQTSGTNNALKSVYFTDANTGYAVGGLYYQDASNLWNYKNVIIKTIDGGANWSTINSEWNGGHDDIILNSVFFINSNTGWAVGNCDRANPLYWTLDPVIKKTTDGGSSWVSQSSGGITNPLLSVYFINDSIGYATGCNGIIIKTTNGGTNWVTLNSGTSEDINSVFFINDTIGYCAGNNSKILKTINGGTTWNILNPGISSSFKSLKFASANVGYIVGDNGTIIKTSNGGATWTIQTTNMSYCLNTISLISQDTLYVAGNYGSILKTFDGGNNWITESSINNKNINSIFFVSSNKGWVVGEGPSYYYPDNMITQGLIAITTNGGVKQPEATTLSAKISSNYVKVRGNVHPNGLPTQVYFEYGTTNSYGNIIEAANSPTYTLGECEANITGFQMYSTYHFRVKAINLNGTAYGSDMTFTYINGWQDQESGVSDDLKCVQFVNDSTGFIVGNNGIILKTKNYGANWISKNSGTNDGFSSCFFPSQDIGYTSTYSGLIYKTVNGGDAWSMIKDFGYTIIYGIYFTSNLNGIAVGGSGKIYRTTDGGTIWSTIPSGVTSSLNSVTFSRSSSNYGYIVGDNGKFFATTNNGLNWTSKTTGITTNLISVNTPFAEYYAFSVGANGISKNSHSYGDYFNNGNTGTTQNLNSNYFITDALGYAVGKNGTIIKTTDEAMNWSSQQINSTNDLNSVYFTNRQSGWAVGKNGTILHTNTGGCSDVEIITQPSNIIKCSGQNNTFSISAVGRLLNYKWYKNDTLLPNSNNSNYLISNISQSDTGSYYCVVYNECSSDTSVTVTLGILQSPTAFAGSDISICTGSSTTLNATGGTAYSWNPATGLSATNICNPVANPTSTTTYTVTVSNANGCAASDNVVVTVNSLGGSFSLSNPANGVYVSTTPTFVWSSSSGATFYQLYIDGILKKANITGTSYALQSNEAIVQGMHTWYVMSNGCSQSNEEWSIRVDAIQPTAFSLVSPDDNSWTASTQPTLSWGASIDVNSGLAKYQLWIDGVLNRDNISTSATSTTPTTVLTNGSHTWEIRAIDIVGNVRNSTQIWTVKVDNMPPALNNSNTYFLQFNGSTNYVVIPNSSSLNITNQKLTIEAWVKISAYKDWASVVIKGLNNSDYALRQHGGKINFSSQDYGGYDGNTVIPLNTWTHIAVTYDGTNISFYFNGVYDGGAVVSNYIHNYSESLYVGVDFPSIDEYWNGSLDEIRIWNYTKTQTEIINNKDIPLSGFEANLAGYWRFNEGSGSVAFDMTNNHNNGTINGATFQISPSILCNLKTPTNNQFITSSIPSFAWGSTQDSGIGFNKFQLFVDGNIVKDNLTDSTYTITTLLSYGQHTWYVKGFDLLGNNQSSYNSTFYVDKAKPIAFNLISPVNNQIVNLPTPNFTWQATSDSTGGSGLRKYQLLINGVVNRDSISITQTTVAPKNALVQGAYTWSMNAYDNVGNVRQSTQTNTFYIDWENPTAFTLISPLDNSTLAVAKPEFKWHKSTDIGSGISKYELNITGQTPITILPTDTTKLITSNLPNGSYTWYVKAYDVAGGFTNSNTQTFTINAISGIEDTKMNNSIKVYPNPVENELIIESDGSTSFEILNLMGQVIYNGNLIKRIIVQTSNLSTGVYLIKFKTGKSFEFKRFIKK